MMRVQKLLILIGILLITGCAQQPNQNQANDATTNGFEILDSRVSASGIVVPTTYVYLSFPSGGQNLELFVTAGEQIWIPELLAQVDSRPAELALESAEAQLDNSQAILTQLEDSEFATDGEIEAAEASVRIAEVGVEQAQLNLNNTKLYPPINGTVIEIFSQPGEIVTPGAPVMLIADLSTLQVQTTDLNEIDVTKISLGDKAEVVFDALPEINAEGAVVDIAVRNANVAGIYYTVSIELAEIPEGLRWGMSAFVQIETGD
jgi:multidrug resistance efflux pump